MHLHDRTVGRRLARLLAFLTALVGVVVAIGAIGAGAATHKTAATPDFGPNVKILDPSMTTAQIKAVVDPIYNQQINDEFGPGRYAILLRPGTYGTNGGVLTFGAGYYTQVAGLGLSPNDVQLTGNVHANNHCDSTNFCTGLTNFWRSLENMTINVASGTSCQDSNEIWAVSQAAPMRRIKVNGFTTFADYCNNPRYTSGGFIADSSFGFVLNDTQQQFLTRNSSIGFWSNAVWNQVFAGVQGAPAQSFPNPTYTTLDTNPVSREAPFLTVDTNNNWGVYVPDVQTNGSGPTWANGQTPGHLLPISSFFVAKPTDSAQAINNALAKGQNLIFTPGTYDLSQTIDVKRQDTIVLGLGMATLTAENGVTPLKVEKPQGVEISGIILDAGPVNSDALLQVGTKQGGPHDASSPSDPTLLADVFFRVGGPHVGKVTTALVENADNTILDDVWAWRADHGSGVGWTSNTADHGVIVNGDNVTATGLFVEHFQKEEVMWNGNGGTDIFFQNEMPYDPPNQAAWTQPDGTLGYPSFEVANSVTSFQGYGLGSYIFTNVDPTIHADHAFQSPVSPGVQWHDLLTLSISNQGTIDHVINGTGAPTPNNTTISPVVSYP
jgi:hypothetical protein